MYSFLGEKLSCHRFAVTRIKETSVKIKATGGDGGIDGNKREPICVQNDTKPHNYQKRTSSRLGAAYYTQIRRQ